MKMTLDLPDEWIRELKIQAGIERRTVDGMVIKFIRQGLGLPPLTPDGHRAASAMVVMNDEGLPVIRCRPHPPATRMNAVELLALEQKTQTDEDLKHAGLTA